MRGGAISFEIDGVHPHDVSQVLDSRGIAVRAGHHCAKPAHNRFGVQSSTRASSYLYTTPAEIDALVEGLEYTKQVLQVGLSDGPRLACTRRSSWTTTRTPTTRVCATRSRRRCTTSTPPAVTR